MRCWRSIKILLHLIVVFSLCSCSSTGYCNKLDWSKLGTLGIAHDQRRFFEIIKFVSDNGLWSLQSAYDLHHIDRQTLLDIAALTGYLGFFYLENGLSWQEKTSRRQLIHAISWTMSFREIPYWEIAFLPEDARQRILFWIFE